MKVSICQINPVLGDLDYNFSIIKKNYEEAISKGSQLVIFPELAITGYPPQDLLYDSSFIERNLAILENIASFATVPLIVGFVRKSDFLHNSAALCENGKVVQTYDKILLPNYDVFDEKRYFTPGTDPEVWEINGKKVGIQICEDLWDQKYDFKVSQRQKEIGAELLVNISASPYNEGKIDERYELICEKVKLLKTPYIYCNMVGGQDEIIYDGSSLFINSKNEVVAQGKLFEEDILFFDINDKSTKDISKYNIDEEKYKALCLGLKDYVSKTGHSKAVIGLSGGIDSSLVACIAADSLGSENVLGISMPSKFSSDHSLNDAQLLSDNLGIKYIRIRIEDIVEQYEKTLHPFFKNENRDVTEENIQARIRGDILMAVSNKFGHIVLSTGNKTELALGYCTLYGDMSGGLSVIADLSKLEVYSMANWKNKSSDNLVVPQNCIDKPASAELSPNQVDPFDYNIVSPLVDEIIEHGATIENLVSRYPSNLVHEIVNKIRLNEYKRRQAAPSLRVSSKAFGVGRRFPIVNKFQYNKK